MFLSDRYPLAPERIEALRYLRRDDGYVHYFVDDDRATATASVRAQLPAGVQPGADIPAIRPFAHAFRFADLARRLMGIGGVRLWFDQVLYKQPGGRLTDYHKDAAFRPMQPVAPAPGDDPELFDIFNVTEDIPVPGELDWRWVPLAR